LRKSSQEKWDEDPIFFEKFSKLVRDTIANFHNGRISDLTYLSTVKELRDKVQSRQDEADPTPVRL
jgi:type I restriction enzyme R subunit